MCVDQLRLVRQQRDVRDRLVDFATMLLVILAAGTVALVLDTPWWGGGLIAGGLTALLMLVPRGGRP